MKKAQGKYRAERMSSCMPRMPRMLRAGKAEGGEGRNLRKRSTRPLALQR
jgi:hypothetical protein